jgi:hypothetical protein
VKLVDNGRKKTPCSGRPVLGSGPSHSIPSAGQASRFARGLAVSYITTPGNAKRLQPEVEGSNLDIRLVPIPMPPIDGVPPGIDSTDNVPMHVVPLLFASSHKLAGAFQEWLDHQMNSNTNDSGPSPVCCIIVDMTTGWARRSGANFGIPSVVFYTCGAFAMSLMHSVFNRTSQKRVDEEFFEVSELIFGLKLRKSDLTVSWRDPDSHPLWNFLREEINGSMEGRGILINTFYELESRAIDYMGSLTGNPVWNIGPLLPPGLLDKTGIDRGNIRSRGKAADIDEDECLQWLDSRRPNSVVFVCLGSQFFLNDKQIHALASGLDASGQAFVWAIRCPQTDPKACKETDVGLPDGFEERTRERGLIIWGWAPQLLILSHPSVGAFLSHCGWNSTLESISAGVPMITWPMFAEQPFNSKLLVERLGIAIQICLDVSGVPGEEEVRRAVIMLLAEEQGNTMRRRAEALSKLAKIAVDKEGSSYTNLESFVQEMQKLHHNPVVLPHINAYNE